MSIVVRKLSISLILTPLMEVTVLSLILVASCKFGRDLFADGGFGGGGRGEMF